MRKGFWWGTLVLAVAVAAQGATNDLTTALQKGLFEEEANRNLDAAIQAYQSVANQFDKDRKLAATAIFRLGECYRKQGNTNGAAAQFERIVREFSDQSTLVTLSRQNLASFGAVATAPAAGSSTQNPVDRATEAEEVKRLRALVKDSPDLLNAPNAGSGMTPLDQAAEAGQLEVAQFLLENGADTEARATRWQGRTALHFAAAYGQKAMVELLLSKQANVLAATEDGLTPLHLAAEKGYRSVAECLLEHGAKVDAAASHGTTPLLLAAAHGFKAVIELLLAHGADINASTSSLYVDSPIKRSFFGTALEIAAQRNDQALAEFLVAKGADLNRVDQDGRTALSRVENGNIPMIKLLLGAHADPNAGSLDLPLAQAAFSGHLDTLKLLLAAGANPNTNSRVSWPMSTGFTTYSQGGTFSPLLLAMSQHHPEAMTLLLQAKADPNIDADNGEPLLFGALRDVSALKALLEGGANPNLRDSKGYTPLMMVEQPAAELLLAHGADPKAADPRGWTALHAAAADGNTNLITLLLQKGADVDARAPETGFTPLLVAVQAGHTAAVKVLLEHNADPNVRANDGTTILEVATSSTRGNMLHRMPYRRVAAMFPTPPSLESRPGQSTGGATAPSSIIPELLREHGALDDLPHPETIELRRPSAHFQQTLFTKDAAGRNRFTVAELVGVEYGLLAGNNDLNWQGNLPTYRQLAAAQFRSVLPYPDLAHVRIRKPAPDFKSWQERTVDVSSLLNNGTNTNDVVLHWGEVVEIPEQDHPIDQRWDGFTLAQMENLVKGLQQHVGLIVNGHATNVSVGPEMPRMPHANEQIRYSGGQLGKTPEKGTLWLKPALVNSGLVLASSDLSRVKLTRRDPATGAKHTWVYDCASANPEVWLQEGDVIEVPEKAQASDVPPPQANR